MKNQNRFICLIGICVLICVLCSGCASKAPEETLIDADINAYLHNQYGQDYVFVDYETTQSITEGSVYTASIDAIAEGKYARLDLTIDLQYTKYDQGWQSDYIGMWLNNYEIINYPTDEEIDELCAMRNGYYDWDVTYTDSETYDDTVICYGYIDTAYNQYFDLRADATTSWSFSVDQNAWSIEYDDVDYYGILTYDIEGSVKINNGTGTRIYVRNQTETSMEVMNNSEDDEWVHVELQMYENDISAGSLKEAMTLTYVGYLSDGERVTVEVSDYYRFHIRTSYEYSWSDDFGYFDTFIPSN